MTRGKEEAKGQTEGRVGGAGRRQNWSKSSAAGRKDVAASSVGTEKVIRRREGRTNILGSGARPEKAGFGGTAGTRLAEKGSLEVTKSRAGSAKIVSACERVAAATD